MPLFGTKGPTKEAFDALQRRVQDLEDDRAVYLLHRDQLITLVSAAENRVRAMVNRAEKATRSPIPGDAASDERQLHLLDQAILARKSRA